VGDARSESDAAPAFLQTDRAAVDWVAAHGQPAGRFTDTLAGAAWWCLPLRLDAGLHGAHGVVAMHFPADVARLTVEQRRLAEAMAEDIAQAVLRTRLVADLEDARVSTETERLRSALLSSVSHDLRSPLSVIIGSAST